MTIRKNMASYFQSDFDIDGECIVAMVERAREGAITYNLEVCLIAQPTSN